MKVPTLIVCAALAVPVTVLGQNTPQDNPGSSQSPQVSLQAQHFLNLLASEDQSEIDLAHLALKKSGNPQIQQYAKSKILAADPAMKQGAMAIAKRTHAPVDGFPTSADKAEYYYLSKLSGKAFDKAYMSYEDQKQAADLITVKDEATSAKNPEIKSYAQKQEAPVQQAAQSARQIAQAISA